ncbi:MAG: helix-turn-helix transcriptional regulator [Collinsella sp.]|nr:helix-turn-helix transcriptional regulator [Collinsella sp.]
MCGQHCGNVGIGHEKRHVILNENIQALRKSKGLSQEELALKLNVVRQTVSKWDRGLSVPDAETLVALGKALDTPVSTLLGETVPASEPEGLQALSEKLEVLNDQVARAQECKHRALHALCIAIAAITAPVLIALTAIGGSYLEWDFSNPEYAVAGTLLHGLEWVFVRIAPIVLLVAIAGTLGTRRKA